MTDLRTPPTSDGDLFSERARQYALEKPLQRIHVLEAGCGWGTGLDLGDRDRHVTGVDQDSSELRVHTVERTDLDTWHLGDLRTVPLPPRAFDIVHATYLIERVPHAELVLDRFVAALKPGGLLLVHLRDRNTAYAFLDRTLPHWLHRSARRGRRRTRQGRGAHARVPQPAGDAMPPGSGAERVLERAARPAGRTAPPTAVYERVASRSGMQWYCVMRGLVVCEEYASRRSIEALGAGTGPADLLCRLVSLLSRGRLTADHSEVTFVIRKPENRFARVI
ncbi:class I SAM-dependent methyltransferase [Actinomadura decatromicini]|uniref:Class I SAM-dependent methyltransferase n=1 Tax=Actinomadura decatromicini TaxID=2604572 RepID=A0A5D3FNU5_9ACTN|nr:class I SAM-dependent methyltransferase [Actinomadura decatromicini]TYK49330.1 class I SAM-dependent methyltransferase [Actinomadura decatromicini]